MSAGMCGFVLGLLTGSVVAALVAIVLTEDGGGGI